jgi:hypothetical protein
MAEETVKAPETPTPTRGEQLVTEFITLAEEIAKDLTKFFDKEQMKPARRVRKNLSLLSKFAKNTRKEISELKNARLAEKKKETPTV